MSVAGWYLLCFRDAVLSWGGGRGMRGRGTLKIHWERCLFSGFRDSKLSTETNPKKSPGSVANTAALVLSTRDSPTWRGVGSGLAINYKWQKSASGALSWLWWLRPPLCQGLSTGYGNTVRPLGVLEWSSWANRAQNWALMAVLYGILSSFCQSLSIDDGNTVDSVIYVIELCLCNQWTWQQSKSATSSHAVTSA